ncbi:hypothetical protein OEZ85_012950 [Tetradesmus obliquus]|uniref:Uncharacterized protein n=1 Tax=Tetradesmus obliquus TaxID=3088 RepID=A0ABY8U460_TETOB|nr:hypothetical protein OEZ85_012950 [Tetradesmus obliquus]
MDIIEVAAARVCELLAVAKKCKGEDFMKVLEGCLHFVSIAEAFTGCSLPLRATVLSSLAACVDSYQKANMEALRMSLALEDWQPLNARSSAGGISNPSSSSSSSSSSSIDTNGLRQQLSNSPYLLPAQGQSGCVADFDVWMQAGNLFTAKARTRAVGGRSVVQAACGQPVQPSDQASGTPSTAAGRVATKSSLLVLRRMNNLAALMPVLPASHPALWAAVSELFDNFLLACFILFSDVNLEALVWQDDLLPHRLRSALLRITTSPGCKYKAQVRASNG